MNVGYKISLYFAYAASPKHIFRSFFENLPSKTAIFVYINS